MNIPRGNRLLMRPLAQLRAAFVVIAMALPAIATAQSLEREIAAALSAIAHPQTRAGVCVIDLKDGTVVFSRGADEPLIPASTMKLFAMASALSELGADFQFETVLATDGTNLLVVGDGDPATGDERLCQQRDETVTTIFDRWAQTLRSRGLTDIAGDLIIDETIFDDERIHPTWEPSDLGKWYAAPVGGLNFNDNCLDITLHPGDRAGSPVRVSVQPPNELVQIVNRCTTSDGTPILHHPPGSLEYKISGRCGKTWPFGPAAFPDPALLFGDSMRTVLRRNGITIRGSIRRLSPDDPGSMRRLLRGTRTEGFAERTLSAGSGDTPTAPFDVLAVHRTPIADVLQRAGKNSQNLFAECLLKRTGRQWALRNGQMDAPGSFELGSTAVIEMARRTGMDTNGLRIVDGSGLSRENATTARQMAHLLAWSNAQPWGAMLRDSLAIAGVDGSLRKRIKDMPERIHAKTGTMRGVRALSGFVNDDSGPRYAFAVLFNGYKGPSTPYKAIQDRVCRILAEAADATE